jgi:hypothetical protein
MLHNTKKLRKGDKIQSWNKAEGEIKNKKTARTKKQKQELSGY